MHALLKNRLPLANTLLSLFIGNHCLVYFTMIFINVTKLWKLFNRFPKKKYSVFSFLSWERRRYILGFKANWRRRLQRNQLDEQRWKNSGSTSIPRRMDTKHSQLFFSYSSTYQQPFALIKFTVPSFLSLVLHPNRTQMKKRFLVSQANWQLFKDLCMRARRVLLRYSNMTRESKYFQLKRTFLAASFCLTTNARCQSCTWLQQTLSPYREPIYARLLCIAWAFS